MTTLEAEFYFSPQKTPVFVFAPIGMRYVSSPTPPPFEHAVRTLCLHGARAFVNTRHAHTIQHLSRSMWLDWCIGALDREPLVFSSPTALSRRLIQVQANVDDVGNSHFWMRIKGLGFFGEGPTAACLTSFFVHYNYLLHVWRQNAEHVRRLEIAAAEIRLGADKEASVLTQAQFARRAADRALMNVIERLRAFVRKEDVTEIFNLTKSGWEEHAKKMASPLGWKTQLQPHDTGTGVAVFDRTTGYGVSVQPLYVDDKCLLEMLVVGGYYPLGTLPAFTASFKHEVERDAERDFGDSYLVLASFARKPPIEVIELMITKRK